MPQSHLRDEQMVAALDGELSPAEQARVADHVAACADCARRSAALAEGSRDLAGLIAADDALGLTPLHVSKARLRAAMADAAERQEALGFTRVMSGPMRPLRWLGAAVAIAAAIVTVIRVNPTVDVSQPSFDGALPIASLTPGATWNLTRDELCSPVRHEERRIANDVRATVVHNYGVEHLSPDDYELDYLITPELGGTPTADNLWPQMYAARTWNALVKDQLEDLLPTLVCSGQLSLQAAQRDLADDWIAAYKRHFQTSVPLAPRTAAASNPSLSVISFAASR